MIFITTTKIFASLYRTLCYRKKMFMKVIITVNGVNNDVNNVKIVNDNHSNFRSRFNIPCNKEILNFSCFIVSYDEQERFYGVEGQSPY